MKKLSLILGFAFMASMAFAQNTVAINQTGNSDKAQVAQTGLSNLATVDQSGGDNNYIDVVSTGSLNKVDVDQAGSNLNASNVGLYGYVHQTGDNNNATLNQVGSYIDGMIDQKMGQNTAVFNQYGSWLQVESKGLYQERTNTGDNDKGNRATLSQGTAQLGATLQSLNVRQVGNDNEFNSEQSGNTNQFTAIQNGLSNFGHISQSGSNNYDDWYSTTNNILTQNGTSNNAEIAQLGNSKFIVDQEGTFNKTGLQLTGSWAKVTQDGNHNIVGGLDGTCTPTTVAILNPGSSLDATQIGDYNELYVNTAGNLTVKQGASLLSQFNYIKYTQTSAGAANLNQAGSSNTIKLKNTSAISDVDVNQVGDGNIVANFANDPTTCALFAGSHLDIDQIGNTNKLNLDSQSAGAVVDVMQKGSNNWASVIQK